MDDASLAGKRVLVVEAEFLIADDLRRALEDRSAKVVGPVATLAEALRLIENGIDGAIVDINLRGMHSFALAEMLMARGIPFVFATGYGARSIPEQFRGIKRCEKPLDTSTVAAALFTTAPC